MRSQCSRRVLGSPDKEMLNRGRRQESAPTPRESQHAGAEHALRGSTFAVRVAARHAAALDLLCGPTASQLSMFAVNRRRRRCLRSLPSTPPRNSPTAMAARRRRRVAATQHLRLHRRPGRPPQLHDVQPNLLAGGQGVRAANASSTRCAASHARRCSPAGTATTRTCSTTRRRRATSRAQLHEPGVGGKPRAARARRPPARRGLPLDLGKYMNEMHNPLVPPEYEITCSGTSCRAGPRVWPAGQLQVLQLLRLEQWDARGPRRRLRRRLLHAAARAPRAPLPRRARRRQPRGTRPSS